MIKKIAHTHVYINVMELLVTEEVDRQFSRLPERVSKYLKRSEVETFALNRLPTLYASSQKGLQYQRDRASKELKTQIVNAVKHAIAAIQSDPLRLAEPIQIEGANPSEADAVLQALSECLRSPNLTWETALPKIHKLTQRNKQRLQNRNAMAEKAPTQRTLSIPPPPVRTPRPSAARDGQAYTPANRTAAHNGSAIPPSVRSTVRHSQPLNRQNTQVPGSEMVSNQHPAVTPQPTQNTTRRPGTFGVRTSWSPRQRHSESDVGFEDTYLR